jgi:hypothetical protein
MGVLPIHSDKRFKAAVNEALQDRRANDDGRFYWSQFKREIADAAGCSVNTLEAYYQGKRTPTPAVMATVARVLDLPAGGAYFRDYRLWQVSQVLGAHPGAMADFYAGIMQVAMDEDGRVPEA